ncbi:TPA: DUF4165 domain-containing protein [Aeromonas hydrophila subsp. hydrophila]|nr:DUF4165 domain-containing protein [Aeromonas hydrophila subsp. hydrophila]
MKLKHVPWAVLVALGLSAPVSAQIYEMSYTDTNGATVVRKPTVRWHNPNGEIIVTHIAGLDRKVKVELLKGSTVLQSQTSALISVANRIQSSDGTEFYGVKFNLAKPADDNFILRSTVYDVNGQQVSTNSYEFNVDTVPPVISGDFVYTVSGWTQGRIDIFGRDNIQNRISISGISDDRSGLAGARYFAVDKNGTKRSKAVSMGLSSPSSISMLANDASASDVTPIDHSAYTVGFEVVDVAGNTGSKSRVSEIDNSIPPYELEVWNSSVNQWQKKGTAVSFENPVKFRVKYPKSEHVDFNGTKFGIAAGYNKTDGNFTYNEGSAAIPANSQSYWLIQTLSGVPQHISFTLLNDVPLGGAAVQGPNALSYRYRIAGGQIVDGTTPTLSKPGAIDFYEVTAEPRPYVQVVSANGQSCEIPANESRCSFDPKITIASGRGYAPYPVWIKHKTNPALGQFSTHIYTYWDFNPPVIEDMAVDQEKKTVTLRARDPDRISNWQISMWDTRDFYVEATEQSGATKRLPLVGSRDESVWVKERVFSFAGLPSGTYVMKGSATDTYGNNAVMSVAAKTIDNVPPSLTFKYLGGAVPNEIGVIKDLRVDVRDNLDSAPVVKRMALSGGPINDALDLGFTKQPDGWQPEVPRMFPTLEAGQEYTLNITASDAQGNIATASQAFSLSPQNMVRHEGITVLATSQSLLDSNDKPLGKISFKGALTDGGSQSRGPQAGYFTLRRDSAFAVMFNGTKVAPGETKDVVIPLDATGSVTLPVWPADTGVKGKASYMLDIPQLTAN